MISRFAALLDRIAYEPRRNGKITLIADYFRSEPDPERGLALAAMTGALTFRNAKAGLIRGLIAERTDPALFALSYDYVGDLSETVALLWPNNYRQAAAPPHLALSPPGRGLGRGSDAQITTAAGQSQEALTETLSPVGRGQGEGDATAFAFGKGHNRPPPTLSEVVATLARLPKTDLPRQLAEWLDALDETGRWALLKLITGSMRIGVSARLAKTAVAALGDLTPDDIEHVWHGLVAPYQELFAWAEGKGPRPETANIAPFRPVMLAHPIEDSDFTTLDPAAFTAEWKWDGIRVQAASGLGADGQRVTRMYSRTGEEISPGFPDLAEALTFNGAIDGELLILREGKVQSFNVLQQRLNRKQVSAALLDEFPAHIRAYDLLFDGEEDIRALPFIDRRKRLEALVERAQIPALDISPLIPFASWEALGEHRADPASAGNDAQAVEGCMIKRADSPYLPGRPKGYWYKWKRDPMVVDAVLMYAQRGHGKRSSFYSDFTFGVWREGDEGEVLVPVGKAYFGFTDEELAELDKYVRRNTINRFGPVREVAHGGKDGLVLEIAFEGLQRSTRHKSGIAMRFPRISRIRWDKPALEADRIGALEALMKG